MTTPAQTPIVATAATHRPRAAVANRAPSAPNPPRDIRPLLKSGSSPPRRIVAGGRRAARQAGQVAAATTIATTPASAAPSGPSSAQPGGRSLSEASSPADGPATTSAPTAMPAAAAGTATSAASVACSPAIRPGENPSARCTPMLGSRRCTSACAPAASIVPAATSATSENATSSEMTIPAACPSSTFTPSRVTNSRRPRPNDTERAWVSVTSAFEGSLSHSSARLAGVSSR